MKNIVLIFPVILFFLLVSESLAVTVSSTNFTIQGPLIKEGSGFSTSSNFRLWSSIGEEAIGLATTSNFTLGSGFLYIQSVLLNIPVSSPVVSGGGATINPTIIVGGGGLISLPTIRTREGFQVVDLNNDQVVNVVDLSILLYHLSHPSGNISPYDFNHDGKIDILDISIMLYYWT